MKTTKSFGTITRLVAFAFVVFALASCLTKKEAEALGDIVGEDLRNAYLVVLDSFALEYPDSVADNSFCGYFVYDVNKDDLPELWLMTGTCEADKQLVIYTCTLEGAEELYNEPAPHVNFYEGDGYVISLGANNGEALETKITLEDDAIKLDTLYMGAMDDESGYVDPIEEPVVLTPFTNREAIEDLFREMD